MNTAKKINVNYSSLVGLKAELLRKQVEVSEAKARSKTAQSLPKTKLKNKRPKESDKKECNEQGLKDVDDIKAHKKSKLMLEAKSRLYEQMKKTKHNNENFLVDFTTKSDESADEYFKEDDYEDSLSDPEESWVEYEDCFGRTRKCLRKDLPLMQKKDNVVKQQIMKRNEEADNEKHENKVKFIPQEKEPEIEIMRKKWEEQSEKLLGKTDVHYQDVLFDEARTHGVGYYAFSQDEEERARQQKNLANLRKQTEHKQKEMKELKELRDKMEQNRLKAARIRRRIRAGLPAELTDEEIAKENMETDSKENMSDANNGKGDSHAAVNEEKGQSPEDEKKNQAKDELLSIENKIKAFGELLGKKIEWREMSQEEWVYKCREKRITEFGPVYDNFQKAGYLEGTEDHQSKKPSTGDDSTGCQSKEAQSHKTDEEDAIFTRGKDQHATFTADENIENEVHVESDDDIIGPLPLAEITTVKNSQAESSPETRKPISEKAQSSSNRFFPMVHTGSVSSQSPLPFLASSPGVLPIGIPPSVPPPSIGIPPPVPPPSIGIPPPVPPSSIGIPPPVPPSSIGIPPPVPPPSIGIPPPVPPSSIGIPPPVPPSSIGIPPPVPPSSIGIPPPVPPSSIGIPPPVPPSSIGIPPPVPPSSIGIPPPVPPSSIGIPPPVPPSSIGIPPPVPPSSIGIPPPVPPSSIGIPPPVPPSSIGIPPPVPPPSIGIPPPVPPSVGIPPPVPPSVGIPPPVPPPSIGIPPPVPSPSVGVPLPVSFTAVSPEPSSALNYHNTSNTHLNQVQGSTDVAKQQNEYYYSDPLGNPQLLTYMYPPYHLSQAFTNIPVPPNETSNVNTTSSRSADNSLSVNTESNTTESMHVIKEEDIAAGLKYLREKFEKRQAS